MIDLLKYMLKYLSNFLTWQNLWPILTFYKLQKLWKFYQLIMTTKYTVCNSNHTSYKQINIVFFIKLIMTEK